MVVENIYEAAGFVIVIAFFVALFALPFRMAKKRGRSAGGWLALSFFITPIWAAIALAVLGDSTEKVRDEIINEMHGNGESTINSDDMNKRTGFFSGLLTGFLLAAFVIMGLTCLIDSSNSSDPVEEAVEEAVEEEEESSLTMFEQPADIIETASFQVEKVLPDGNAIAKSLHKEVEGYYTDPTVLLLADESSPYYDKQIVKVLKGKCAYRVGVYQYKEYSDIKTLPVVRIMDK